MLKTALLSFVGAAALLVCGSASAQLKYNYAEVGYAFSDVESVGDGNGIAAGLSFSPFQNFFVYGNGNWASVDLGEITDAIGDDNGDIFNGELGVGIYFPLSSNLDLVGKAGWTFDSVDFGDIRESVDTNGVDFELGIRTLLGQAVELGAFVGWSDLEELADDQDTSGVAVDVYGIYHLSQSIGVGVATTLQEEDKEFTAFVRFHF